MNGARLRSRTGHAGGRRWLRRSAGVLMLAVSGYLGGVGATSLLPTTVETANYSARVRLSPVPATASTVHSPTLVGDVDLVFDGPFPAPGIDATVQVKKDITAVLAERDLSLTALQPSDTEVSAALSDAARELALRFTAGTVFVAVIGLGLLAYGRQRRLTFHHIALAALTTTAVLAVTAVATVTTYRQGNLTSFQTSGLISTVRESRLLDDVEARARQATPYVRNLLALSEALRNKFSPETIDQPVSARLLLVSDIHGANQYSLMRQIVVEERIDAVIDAGDLLNFGSVTEADATGIFTGIRDLGVPYLFVRGNHDAAGPGDRSLLTRLAAVPNVRLLQPQDGRYVAVSVRGIRIAGFNDPRYFGDDDLGNAAEQQPAAQRFLDATSGQEVDVVVAHEPAALKSVAGRLRLHGHLHQRQLDGNLVGVGTFTGGGTFSHFVERPTVNDPAGTGASAGRNGASATTSPTASPPSSAALSPTADPDGGELTGQPYAFDIAEFGQTCGLVSLTRYTYRDLISGRPAYDDVSVLSGRTIEGDPPADRTCSPADPVTATELLPAPARSGATPTDTPGPQPSTTTLSGPSAGPLATSTGTGGADGRSTDTGGASPAPPPGSPPSSATPVRRPT